MRRPGVASAKDRFKARSKTFMRMFKAEQRPLRLWLGDMERCGIRLCERRRDVEN